MRAHAPSACPPAVDAAVDVELPVELIAEDAEERGLVGRLHRPHGDLVARLLEPSQPRKCIIARWNWMSFRVSMSWTAPR